jgi:hypothetical protein
MATPGLELGHLLRLVRAEVNVSTRTKETPQGQTPQGVDTLHTLFYFKRSG